MHHTAMLDQYFGFGFAEEWRIQGAQFHGYRELCQAWQAILSERVTVTTTYNKRQVSDLTGVITNKK